MQLQGNIFDLIFCQLLYQKTLGKWLAVTQRAVTEEDAY